VKPQTGRFYGLDQAWLDASQQLAGIPLGPLQLALDILE